MKLFRRIFSQVLLAFLALTMGCFAYYLRESREQELIGIARYEEEGFRQRLERYGNELTGRWQSSDTKRFQNMLAADRFLGCYGSHGALAREGEELFNYTPFRFDYEKIRRQWENQTGSAAGGKEYLLTETEGTRVLLFYGTVSLPSGVLLEVVSYKDVSQVFERSRVLLLKGLGFTLVMTVLVGGLLFHGIYRSLRPLAELKEAAAVIAGGNYEIRIPVRGQDEIGEVTRSFNCMAEQVESHVKQLTLQNEAQKQLLGSLAHELKTPMTAIIGYADTLLTLRLAQQQRELALHYIASESRRLSRLAVKLTELAGLSGAESGIKKKEEMISELLGKLKDLTCYRCGEKKLRLETVCVPENLKKELDGDLMMSLLMNLVDNACKASREGGTIWVKADERGIFVEDEGKGIPQEDLPRVTEAFYMVDKSRSRSAGSVGLGLTLCQKIAGLHGARMVIESREGAGTRVSLLWE